MTKAHNFKEMKGQVFGRLTVKEEAGRNKQRQVLWLCECECGNVTIVSGVDLRREKAKSCGCMRKENLLKSITKHGKSRTRLYKVWAGIKGRCENKNNAEFYLYGERKIKMCEEWKDNFQNFYNWAITQGYNETAIKGECTIDRIDVDGDYTPENCRWITNELQQQNKRNNHLLTYKEKTMCIAEWEKIKGFKKGLIRNRLKLGWTITQAIETPIYGDKKAYLKNNN